MTPVPEQPVHIVPYDESWPVRFEQERAILDRVLGGWVVGGIEHVGSTAVPGLAAKPVIDIMVGVDSWRLLVRPYLSSAKSNIAISRTAPI